MRKSRIGLLGAMVLVALIAVFVHRLVAVNGGYTLIAWNNLGMHCIDSDYSVFSILPPYNTINAQLMDASGKLIRTPQGFTVTYQAVNDLSGSINTTSLNKSNFWDYVYTLFGTPLPADAGLATHNMPGPANIPQAMSWDAANYQFSAEGIPITSYDDSGEKNYYPMMHLVARDSLNNILASIDIVLPVSDEMDCRACHASDSSAEARPSGGWVYDPNPERDYRLNILARHDQKTSGMSGYSIILATAGYDPGGLYATVVKQKRPILCAACHGSNALGTSGIGSTPSLTQSVHSAHGPVTDPTNGMTLESSSNRSACYRCHPGSETRCLRGVMGSAVAADGSLAMQCQSCHGPMSKVGAAGRQGWLDEPQCQNCHTGTATQNSGQIRFTSALDASGAPRVAANLTFATNANTPASGLSLYRFSRGHGSLQCEACHGSTHAEYPSIHPNDNVLSLQAQSHVGMIADCISCHNSSPSTTNGGPHGMHPTGVQWASNHDSAVERGGATQCQPCHGTDYRGTVLSRALGDRNISTQFGIKQFWRGYQIGCYSCHNGPFSESANPNSPPVVSSSSASTASGTPVTIKLNASDVNLDPLTLRIVSQSAHGTVALSGTSATYLPNSGYAGADAFTFAAWDGMANSNLGTVTLSVASRLYIPFYQADAYSFTGFAVSNYSAKNANLQFTAFGANGQMLPFAYNPATSFLAPLCQIAKLGSEIFGIPATVSQAGWVQISADIEEIGAIYQFGDSAGTQLDGSVAALQTSRILRFTRVFEGPAAFHGQTASTFLSIANPTDGPVVMSLNLVGPQAGQVLAPQQTLTLPAKGLLAGTVPQIFNSNLTVSNGAIIVQVTAGEGVVGFELVRFPGAKTVLGMNAVTGGGLNQIYSAQALVSPQYFTNLKLINTSTIARTATLHLIGDNGSELATPVTVGLDVGQSIEQEVGQLFGVSNAAGSLRVDANGPGLIGDVIFGDTAALASAACSQLDSQKFSQAVFSQVANAANLWTGLALYNPNAQAVTVTIDVYSEAGIKTGTNTLSLGAGQRLARVLTEPSMVPSTIGQMGGFIMLHATAPIVGQELFGDAAAHFLSAVPPKIIN